MIYRLLAWILRREVVWLRDHDGTVTVRLARRTPYGLTCDRHGFGVRPLLLIDGGKIKPDCYVHEWKPDNFFPEPPK